MAAIELSAANLLVGLISGAKVSLFGIILIYTYMTDITSDIGMKWWYGVAVSFLVMALIEVIIVLAASAPETSAIAGVLPLLQATSIDIGLIFRLVFLVAGLATIMGIKQLGELFAE